MRHRRGPRRPARRDGRPGLPDDGRGQEHLRHRQLPAAEHRHRARPLHARAADHRLLPVRRRPAACTPWRARSRSPARPSSGCATSSGIIANAARSRRWPPRSPDTGGIYFVPGLLRAVRPVLALRRPRRHRRAVPLPHHGPPGPGHAGGDLLPEPRRGRGDGGRLRRTPGRAQGRRRGHRQRALHADPGRRPRRRRSSGRWSPRPPRWAPRTRRGWPSASGTHRTSCGPTGTRTAGGPRRSTRGRAAGGYAGWQKAVERTLDWVEVEQMTSTVEAPQQPTPAGGRTRTATSPWSWSGRPRRRRSTAPAISASATRTRSTPPRSTRCGRCSARSG